MEDRSFMDVFIDQYWGMFTEKQKDWICMKNPNFNIDKYWPELDESQKDMLCENNQNLGIDKYWNELTEFQKCLIYCLREDFSLNYYIFFS